MTAMAKSLWLPPRPRLSRWSGQGGGSWSTSRNRKWSDRGGGDGGGGGGWADASSDDLDGANEFVDFGATFRPAHTSPWTVSLWTKPNGTANRPLLNNESTGADHGIFLFDYGTGSYGISGEFAAGGYDWVTTGTRLDDGVWNHVVWVWNGSVFSAMYKNAVSLTLTTRSNTLAATPTYATNLTLGKRAYGPSYYAGRVDELRIFNKALSSTEVSEIYNSGTPSDHSSYSMSGNETDGWPIGDGDTYPTISADVGTFDGTMTNQEAGDLVGDAPP